jgi:hypothetical protein
VRDVYTCIQRIKCGLPITEEEVAAVEQHLEHQERKEKRLALVIALLFVAFGLSLPVLHFIRSA